MPRLTNHHYLYRHDAQALSHRRATDRARPTLGTSAGKAFAILHRAFRDICDHYPEDSILDGSAVQHYLQHRLCQPGRSVSALFKPEPDLHKLAAALLRLAEAEQSPAAAAEPPEPTTPA